MSSCSKLYTRQDEGIVDQCCCVTVTGTVDQEALKLDSNVKLVKWAPQNDILGHSAVEAFVTHAGSNSLYEAAYHGKPVVSVPIMNEQPANAVKVGATYCFRRRRTS